ncbi:hypothetical protein [Flavobacterium algicola]|uniref:hypothetical protein n=1 Tax=Flavobacterium algicola TaxID=556529 RepID=UPI001EFCE550|nr:hypothetical protein [Flavobacterium algicola]MCG9793748.1 hypothetical protein [Flavobacterium algicola]
MKGDLNNNLNKGGRFSKVVKTELAKNESKEKTKTDSAGLTIDVSEIEVKHFKRVDKQGDLFSDFFSDFKK